MKTILNVGLARSDGKPDNGVLPTVATLNQHHFTITAGDLFAVNGEASRTLVLECVYTGRPGIVHEMTALAEARTELCIDAIMAEIDGKVIQVGGAHGRVPDFNPEAFLRLTR